MIRVAALGAAVLALSAPPSFAAGGLTARERMTRPTLPPTTATPTMPTKPSDTAAVEQETSLSVTANPTVTFSLVTMDYLRMHQPTVVARLATLVRQGSLPASALDGIGTPELTQGAITTDWSDLLSRPGASTSLRDARRMSPMLQQPAQAADTSLRPHGAPYAVAGVDEAAAAAHLGQFAVIDSPVAVDLGAVEVGERHRQVISAVVLDDGILNVTPAPGSLVRVLALRLNTGVLQQGVRPRTGVLQSGSTVTAAPWRVAVTAGQKVDIVVAFDPRAADGFDGSARPYQTSLALDLDQGSAVLRHFNAASGEAPPRRSIALRATVQGVLYGAGLSFPEPLYDVRGLQTMIPYELDNSSEAGPATVTVTLKTDGMPAGLMAAGPTTQTVQLAPGEHRTGDAFVIESAPQFPGSYEQTLTILVSQTTPKGTQTLAYTAPLEILNATVLGVYDYRWHDKDKILASAQSTFVLQANGAWDWTGSVKNINCTKVDFKIDLRVGEDVFHQEGRAGNNLPVWGPSTSPWHQSGIDGLLGRYYAEVVTYWSLKPSSVEMSCFATGVTF